LSLNKIIIRIGLVFCISLLCSTSLFAQGRAVKQQVTPSKPDIAKKMHVSGDVKVEVIVAPNGTVKSAKPLGGHPLLVDAAVDAAKRFKFDTGTDETKETIVFHFPDL